MIDINFSKINKKINKEDMFIYEITDINEIEVVLLQDIMDISLIKNQNVSNSSLLIRIYESFVKKYFGGVTIDQFKEYLQDVEYYGLSEQSDKVNREVLERKFFKEHELWNNSDMMEEIKNNMNTFINSYILSPTYYVQYQVNLRILLDKIKLKEVSNISTIYYYFNYNNQKYEIIKYNNSI